MAFAESLKYFKSLLILPKYFQMQKTAFKFPL